MIEANAIRMRGVRTHNLKNIDLDLPLRAVTCIGGPSGSGKSSLAFHTLMTESRRRFLNSLPNDIKFFWDIPGSVDVDELSPVLPVWVLPQNNPVVGARQTIADLIGFSERLEKLIFELGEMICPHHKIALEYDYEQDQQVTGQGNAHVFILKEDFQELYGAQMFPARSLAAPGAEIHTFDPDDLYWEVYRTKVFDLIKLDERIPKTFKSNVYLVYSGDPEMKIISRTKEWSCPEHDYHVKVALTNSYQLSALNASGACPECEGHGMILKYDRLKLVKNDSLSLSEGAVSFLKYKRFEHLYSAMLAAAKAQGFDTKIPFSELDEKVWDFLFAGAGKYPGFKSLLEYLEGKRYKASVRIFLRGLQHEVLCPTCLGDRASLRAKSYGIKIGSEFLHMGDFQRLTIAEFCQLLQGSEFNQEIPLVKALHSLCQAVLNLGLGHLSLLRKVKSVSPGEYQRLLLSKYLSFEGSGSLFVLDEPTIGLGVKELEALWEGVARLRDQGNTVVIVDHSPFMKLHSDFYVEMGPGAGALGGEITFQGKYSERSLGEKASLPTFKSKQKPHYFSAKGVKVRSLPKRDFKIAVNIPNLVYGHSGSGKTSYLVEGVANTIHKKLTGEWMSPTEHEVENINIPPQLEAVEIYAPAYQKFTSRSTVGTYLGITPYLRKHFSSLKVSKDLGLVDGHFSPNSDLGKCPRCDGKGKIEIDMSFLESIEMVCDECQGMKLRPFIATISDGEYTYYESVNLPLEKLFAHMKLTPKLRKIRELLLKLKLEYLSTDRTLESLSGGEKQRIRLLQGLISSSKPTFMVLKNVSVGLSEREIPGVLEVVYSLSESGHIVVIIDQNPQLQGLGFNEISVS